MRYSSESIESLVEQFSRLPTIGRKSAQRLVAHVLKMTKEDVERFAKALLAVKERVKRCSICQNVTDDVPCALCRSDKRDQGLVCVVAESNDILALERTGEYVGVYHVLGGVISPLDGIGPDDLRIRELIQRLGPDAKHVIREVILAVNPTVEGDTTAFYLAQLLTPFGVQVTRLARGLPVGSDLSFSDEATLTRALAGRGPL